jgi:hypothetical protein
MDKPLKQHVVELERRIQRLSQEMMQNRKTLVERNRIESELRVAQQALTRYQQAIQLEKQLQSPSAGKERGRLWARRQPVIP